jgi:serine/threonine protein kinase
MAELDIPMLVARMTKLQLVTEAQIQECMEGLEKTSNPDLLLGALERKGYLSPWQSNKLLQGETDGFFLGGYRLLYRVGSGSFGRVYRAADPSTGAGVAVKVLRQRWSEDERTVGLFQQEGKVGQSLHHPNIVSILSVDRDPASKQHYIAMEFVEGGNLRDILAKTRKHMDPKEALRYLEDAVTGLVYAYSLGVTHRDIKASNILISSQGTAKLVDFGLAGIFRTSADGKRKMYRTVDYAGLERATGVEAGDVRSDIFFLGCVLFEMLTGRPPLELSKNEKARMHKDRFLNMATLKPGDVDAPPSVFHLLNTMMSLNPQRRFQTPSQLLEAVRKTRRDLEAPTTGENTSTERIVFVIEKNDRLQGALRHKFKEIGYRVLLSSDPMVALNRYQQKPFDAVILDAGSTDRASVYTFERILMEAAAQKRKCAGILILSQEQAELKDDIEARPLMEVFVRPVTLKQLTRKLKELMPLPR